MQNKGILLRAKNTIVDVHKRGEYEDGTYSRTSVYKRTVT